MKRGKIILTPIYTQKVYVADLHGKKILLPIYFHNQFRFSNCNNNFSPSFPDSYGEIIQPGFADKALGIILKMLVFDNMKFDREGDKITHVYINPMSQVLEFTGHTKGGVFYVK